MNRRQFFSVTSCIVASGCGRRTPPDPSIADSHARRSRHLAELAAFRVDAAATRTTPPPPRDVAKLVPELKALSKVTVRLHPRYGDEPRPDESKLGGRILWPADEPWPTDGGPLVPVLQLRAEDAPPNFAYSPGTDLLQLLWCPRAEVKPVIAWRKRSSISSDLAPYPDTSSANMDYVPVPCRLFPERVTEYPSSVVLPAGVRRKLELPDYDDRLAVAGGTKVGGYPRWPNDADPPACATCGWGMDYLLTVAGKEWDDRGRDRWVPKEEADVKDSSGFQSAAGLSFGSVLLFVCRRCEHWPIGYRLV